MKKIITIGIVAMFALTANFALAQGRPGKQQRQPHQQHSKRVKPSMDVEHKAIRQAEMDCRQAEKLMKAALPIYQGHRHRAMEINKITLQVLKAAFVWNPNSPNKPSAVQQELAKIGSGQEEPASKYSPAEVARSNDLMRKALAKLQEAQRDLSQIHGGFGGLIEEARQLLELSVQEVNAAQRIVPNP